MRTIFVTGGAGFIGSALVRSLVRDGDARIVTIDALTYAGNLDSLGEVEGSGRHVFVRADVRDAVALRALFEEYAPVGVFHLAAESHVDRSIDGPGEFISTNVVGTATLLQAAQDFWASQPASVRDAFRLVNVSTDEVFGSLGDDGCFTEESRYQPNSPYAASKAAADHLARAWCRTYGLPVITTNSSNNYGPYQFPEKLIPLMIRRACTGTSLPVYGSGTNVRDWLHVDDHVTALRLLLERGISGEQYLIGGASERRNIDVVRAVCGVLDELRPRATGSYEELIEFVDDRPGHDYRYATDCAKIERELGWTRRHTFEHGLRETVQWYLDNEQWTERVLSGRYRGERLGLSKSHSFERV